MEKYNFHPYYSIDYQAIKEGKNIPPMARRGSKKDNLKTLLIQNRKSPSGKLSIYQQLKTNNSKLQKINQSKSKKSS